VIHRTPGRTGRIRFFHSTVRNLWGLTRRRVVDFGRVHSGCCRR